MEQMRAEAHKYMFSFDTEFAYIFLMKPKGEVVITPKRARLWVEAGVPDLDVRSTEKMLEVINIIEKIQIEKKLARKGGK